MEVVIAEVVDPASHVLAVERANVLFAVTDFEVLSEACQSIQVKPGQTIIE